MLNYYAKRYPSLTASRRGRLIKQLNEPTQTMPNHRLAQAVMGIKRSSATSFHWIGKPLLGEVLDYGSLADLKEIAG
jgi:hypothetical protein